MSERLRAILQRLFSRAIFVFFPLHIDDFADNNIVTAYLLPWPYQAISIQLCILTDFDALCLFNIRLLNLFSWTFSVMVSSEKHRSEVSPVNRALVHHDRIFLIIA